ncbi:had-superfamily hydrolase [Lentinula edodes]|uniref:Had-superfamily hydrolase n=1 Tax=Lentinula edodes TaxID=5353 RepID=A0A1Q3E8J2_LENED|nr:had-superfamily hydrolase [Lentinula edodes]
MWHQDANCTPAALLPPTFKFNEQSHSCEYVTDPHLAQSLDILASISPPTSSRPVIAVDLDDVLSQTNAEVARWHNEQYGTNMTLNDFYYYYYWKARPTDLSYCETQFNLRGIEPLLGRKLGLDQSMVSRVICTGQFKDATKDGHEIVTKLSKAQVCADLKARLLIDDSSENALQVSTSSSAATPPTPVLLFGHYEWNKRLSLHSDAVDAMAFDTRLQIEGGREFWKYERFEDHIPEGAPLHRVRDWEEVVQFVKSARAANEL